MITFPLAGKAPTVIPRPERNIDRPTDLVGGKSFPGGEKSPDHQGSAKLIPLCFAFLSLAVD